MKTRFTWLTFIATVAAAASSAACSGGSDVYVESHPADSKSALACAIAPGEDVCSRPFAELTSPARASLIGAFAVAAELAGLARTSREEIDGACGLLLDHLGVARPPSDPSATSSPVCEAAAAAASKVDRAAFTITPATASCEERPPPICAVAGARPRTGCFGVGSGMSVHSGAGARAEVEGNALMGTLVVLVLTKNRLQLVADLSAELTSHAAVLADAPPDCAQTVTQLINDATRDSSAAAALVARLGEVIQPDL
jgi:hypothetical protein